MPSFRRETLVDAPLEEVWAFHSTIDGLRALTPGWLALRIDAIEFPERRAHDAGELVAGTRIRASVAPLRIGPRRSWVSVIESRTVHDDTCTFVDTMHDGPFTSWKHTHRFVAVGEQTRVIDRVDYRVPGGPLGEFLASGGLSLFFAYRHRRTRQLLGEPNPLGVP